MDTFSVTTDARGTRRHFTFFFFSILKVLKESQEQHENKEGI